MRPYRPRIAVSIGCPCGIGPEVSVVAAAAEKHARIVLVGDEGAIRVAAKGRRVDVSKADILVAQPTRALAARDRVFGKPTRASGAAQLAWVDAACDMVASGEADALVTGPVSKAAIVRGGARAFRGHTEHLQTRLGAREVVMAFWSPRLSTSLVTTHLPLARVPRAITAEGVARSACWLAWLLANVTDHAPRIAVASLNPHAGESGLLGSEERTRIAPGVALARARLRDARITATIDGPIPAESAFRLALGGAWDGVVAMYHDQATIPMKVASFGDAVNVTLALPIVRTSVDHGTGYDIAGRWIADASGMRAAIALAAALAPNAAPRSPTRASRAAPRTRPRR